MSQLTDEQIQQLLEAGQSLPTMASEEQASEARQYQFLFKELKEELPIQPDFAFSDRVMSRIDRLESASTASVSTSWLWLGLSLSLFMLVLMLAPVNLIITDLWSALALIKPVKWGLAFGLFSLFVVQLLDFKLIREPSLPKLT